MKTMVLFFFVSLTFLSCGGSSSSGGSCDFSSGSSICIVYGAGYPSSTVTLLCSAGSGTIATSGTCSSTNRVGQCAFNFSGLMSTTHYYSTGGNPYNATTAESNCTSTSGTWTANFVEPED